MKNSSIYERSVFTLGMAEYRRLLIARKKELISFDKIMKVVKLSAPGNEVAKAIVQLGTRAVENSNLPESSYFNSKSDDIKAQIQRRSDYYHKLNRAFICIGLESEKLSPNNTESAQTIYNALITAMEAMNECGFSDEEKTKKIDNIKQSVDQFYRNDTFKKDMVQEILHYVIEDQFDNVKAEENNPKP